MDNIDNHEHEEELYLTDLIGVDILQRLQDAFSDMTGMAALTTDKYGVPVTEGSNFTDFCNKYTRETPLGNSRCMRCDKTGAELTMNSKKPCFYYCHAGLVDYAAPIIANGKMVGSFIGGQVLPAKPNLEAFEKTAIELGIDPEVYKEAVSKVRVVDDDAINKAANFLYVVAECLSYLAYQGYELHKSNVEIEKASNMKSDFLANMSHEIRTPMNAVLGMIELTLREEMSSAARECMYQIRASAKNLLVIINDILDFSKIESGKMDIIDVVYEPLSIVNDLAGIANSKIGTKDIEFTMNVAPDTPKTLFGDNVRIHQILLNLITNAVKFTQQGEVHLDFRSTAHPTDKDKVILKVAISDTGIGIKENDFKKIFNSFQQVDSKRNRNIEGTGLGLVICKQLLELMGGSISVQSEYGKGSTFSFEVPQKIVDKTPAIPQLEKSVTAGILINNVYAKSQLIRDLHWIGAQSVILNDVKNFDELKCEYIIISGEYFTESLREYLKKHEEVTCIVVTEFGAINDIYYPNVKMLHKPIYSLNLYNAMGISSVDLRTELSDIDTFTFVAPDADVLIIDDNAVNLKVAKGLIEPLKMNVETVDSAAKAIELVSKNQYDLLFMDHMMPEVDGIEATHIIRRMLPAYKNTPIIALTANAVGGAKELFISEGMNDFVAKPIEIRDIVAKIRKWLPQEKIRPVDRAEIGEMTIDKHESSLEIKGLNVKEAVKMLGSEKLYLTVLKEYYNSIDEKSRSIQRHRWAENWKEYTIEVHSLKSTSRQIGAEYVGDLAAELEQAGNDGNIVLIREKNDHMISEYLKYKELLAPMFSNQNSNIENDENALHGLLDSMADVLSRFDILEIDETIEKIKQCGFPQEQQTYFDKFIQCFDESDIDNCQEILKEWKQNIECLDEKELTANTTQNSLQILREALADFDILRIEEAIEMLEKYTYSPEQQQMLEIIQQCVQDSDIDGCAEAVEKWLSLL